MGIFDKIKDTAAEAQGKVQSALQDNEEQIEAAIDQVGDFIDDKTGGKYADKIDQAQDVLKDQIGKPNV